MSEPLKPCPFCGSPVEIRTPDFETPLRRVRCMNCNACGSIGLKESLAIEHWNRRATDPELEALRELETEIRDVVHRYNNHGEDLPALGICPVEAILEKLDKLRGGE